jgi:meiotic recombination protein REC8
VQVDQDITFNDALPVFRDDELPLPDAPPFPPLPHVAATPAEPAPQSSFSQPEEEVPSSAEAHQDRLRAPKVTQADWPQELANADLAKWNANYLANMAEATKIKQQHKAVRLARKNAAFWVLGRGIAGVGTCSGDDRVPNPLAIFSGHTLLEALIGRERSPSRMKRTRSPSDDRDEEGKARCVRARGEDEQELGRDDAVGNGAEEFILGADDSMIFPGEDVVCMCFSLTVIC